MNKVLKKFFSMLFTLSLALLPISQASAAPTLLSASNTVSTSKISPSPNIDTWMYQNDTPIVGNESQYNTYEGSEYPDLHLEKDVISYGVIGLTAALGSYLPSKGLAAGIAAAVFAAVQNNTTLNTPSLYVENTTWGMDGSSSLNYEVMQTWYADSAHTQYICTTIYYASFI